MRRRLGHPAERLSALLGAALIVALWSATLSLYQVVSVMEWHALWDHQPRALMAYTKKADTRYAEAFRKAQSAALRRRWFVPEIELRQSTGLFDLWYLRWTVSHIASINAKQQQIVLDDKRTSLMTDDELECVMAHEIGHFVDYRYSRERDMNLWPHRCETREAFADSVGSMLCGRLRYWRFYRAHIEYRFPSESPCDSDPTPVTQ